MLSCCPQQGTRSLLSGSRGGFTIVMSGAPTSPITSSSRMGWGVQRLLAAIFICSQIVVRAEAILAAPAKCPTQIRSQK